MNTEAQSYRDALSAIEHKLIIQRYSESTINTYRFMFKEFLKYLYPLPLHQVTLDDITGYHHMLITKRNVSRSYQNQSINSIKFYLEQVVGRDRTTYDLERPKKEKKLPTVLSQEEVGRLFSQVRNVKHRTILVTIYSCGLRISELLNLEVKDVDSDRMEVRIRGGKGRKDRITVLSPLLLQLLRTYYRSYKPVKFLFEGQSGGRYSASSIRRILERAVKKTGIQKDVVVHTLRHSFGTHLLENGVNLRYIQVLMGHGSPKTTEIYTHVAQGDIHKVTSPLDHLNTTGYI